MGLFWGDVEAIEAAGQRSMCAKSVLPLKGTESADEWAALGVTLGPPVDHLFRAVTLPEGWKIVAHEDHSMWSDLVDAFGAKRASIFYKAAPYDQRAHVRITQPVTPALSGSGREGEV